MEHRSHQVTGSKRGRRERTRTDEVVVLKWLAPWAEWDAVVMETKPCPVPLEMSRAGVGCIQKLETD